jgi:hypothetical protein
VIISRCSSTLFSFLCRTIQISHARRAGEPSLLKYGAMLSGDDMDDLGESKGVVLWLLDRLFLQNGLDS